MTVVEATPCSFGLTHNKHNRWSIVICQTLVPLALTAIAAAAAQATTLLTCSSFRPTIHPHVLRHPQTSW
jgi:hypothetical protein